MAPRRFRFRPRHRALAWSALALGAVVAAAGALSAHWTLAAFGPVAGILGAAYLASPAWRLAVTVDDDGLEVGSPGRQRFRLGWNDVVRVTVSPATATAFVDGGAPDRSLLIPGLGAPAGYDVEDKAALVAAIVAAVPADRVTEVDRLDPDA